MTGWQDLVEFIHDPETQAAVAKYEAEEAEPPPQPQQAALWEVDDGNRIEAL